MEKETQNLPQYIRCKEIVLKRSKEYAQKNKEKIRVSKKQIQKYESRREKDLLKNVKNGLIDKIKKKK